MLFKDILKAVHPHLMKDANRAEFVRNIIQMLCNIPEDEWDKKSDPSSKEIYSDENLRKIYSRGITKKLAKAILGHLSHDTFIDSIYKDREDVLLQGLVEDISSYISNVTIKNVGDKLFTLFKESLEEQINPELATERSNDKIRTLSASLKKQYGIRLLEDCEYICSMPNCCHSLQKNATNGKSSYDYEIITINSRKKPDLSNICAVCHDCFEQYLLEYPSKTNKSLLANKNMQEIRYQAKLISSQAEIDKGIARVVEGLKNLDKKELSKLNYEPVALKNKIDEEKNLFFADIVKGNIDKYFFAVNKVMQELAKQNGYNDDLVRAEIKALYINLEQNGLSQNEIYDSLSNKIHQLTKENILFCNIVVCYFIQSCEVFHDITK